MQRDYRGPGPFLCTMASLCLPPSAAALNPAQEGLSLTEYGYEQKTGVRAVPPVPFPLFPALRTAPPNRKGRGH